jgi:hypothetical protein
MPGTPGESRRTVEPKPSVSPRLSVSGLEVSSGVPVVACCDTADSPSAYGQCLSSLVASIAKPKRWARCCW